MDGIVLTAAGTSSRFGGTLPKVLTSVAGVPLLVHALRTLVAALPQAALVVTARPEDQAAIRPLLPKTALLVDGGATRQASVLAGLRALPERVEHVLVHDAARPLPSVDLVRRVHAATLAQGAAVPGLPVSDSVHRLGRDDANRLEGSVDRTGLFAVQTPQGARAAWLREALERAEREGRTATDEAGLLVADGRPVATVAGEPWNLKITYPEDLALAEALLRARAAARPGGT